MRALDRLKKAVNMASTRRSVELPDGSEFEFWMTPLTLAERSRAQRQAKTDDATEFALQLLVTKAVDENGQKMFAPGELAELRNELPAAVVELLLMQLLTDSEAEEEEELDPKPSLATSRKTAS